MDDSSTGPNEPSGGAADASDTADLARRQRRVFCNRSLRLDQVEWVGFDMDYTLAIYNQAEMDRAAVRSTLGRLVGSGYPADLAELVCPLDFPVRGLLVDIERGNVLKMDRYRYVKVAHHGLTLLSRDERRALYEQRPQPGATGFQWVDTLYSLADVTVYCAVIDALDRAGVVTEYAQLWRDVRRCADDVHRSGEIYALIEAEFERFVQPDPMLAPLLHRLRSSGKKLFLLT
ncbi:MAG: HAD-IG family 5'-nucleotidase, partial [Acidimicrobiia bacterium]|nr:HAD-IG family 5'-nucleotidase [Acidimicrobiia bacterium]